MIFIRGLVTVHGRSGCPPSWTGCIIIAVDHGVGKRSCFFRSLVPPPHVAGACTGPFSHAHSLLIEMNDAVHHTLLIFKTTQFSRARNTAAQDTMSTPPTNTTPPSGAKQSPKKSPPLPQPWQKTAVVAMKDFNLADVRTEFGCGKVGWAMVDAEV